MLMDHATPQQEESKVDERAIEQQPKPERSKTNKFIRNEKARVQGFEERSNAIERGNYNSRRNQTPQEPSYTKSVVQSLLPFLFAQRTPDGHTPGDEEDDQTPM